MTTVFDLITHYRTKGTDIISETDTMGLSVKCLCETIEGDFNPDTFTTVYSRSLKFSRKVLSEGSTEKITLYVSTRKAYTK